jgi:hypothetical protein
VKGTRNELTVVAAHRFAEPVATDLAEACARARCHYVVWNSEEHETAKLPASLLIAELPSGQRRVPGSVLKLATRVFPGIPVVLLSNDPLVRPAVSLSGGRLTLIQLPIDVDRLATRLRILLADQRRTADNRNLFQGATDPNDPVLTRDQLSSNCWIARIGCRGAADAATTDSDFPTLHHDASDGLVGVIGAPAPSAPEWINQVVDGVRSVRDDDQRESLLASTLSENRAMVHLSPSSDGWTFYWPHAEWPLWIYSPLRLPNWWDLSATIASTERRMLSLPAYAGDMVIALSGQPSTSEIHEDGELSTALNSGGPAVVDLLANRLRKQPQHFGGLLVEVR